VFGKFSGPILCDVNNPNSRDAKDCHRFYHCVDTLEGPELVEKTCGRFMMYNHEKQVCDWPETVIKLRPECAGMVKVFSFHYCPDYQFTCLVYLFSVKKNVSL
jgi:hypothetical protein